MLSTENHKWFKVVGIKISSEHVNFWAKSLLFRTHHLWNSTTDLILLYMSEGCTRLCSTSDVMLIAVYRIGIHLCKVLALKSNFQCGPTWNKYNKFSIDRKLFWFCHKYFQEIKINYKTMPLKIWLSFVCLSLYLF